MNLEKSVDYAALWTPALEFYSTYNVAHLQPIVKKLISYVVTAPTSKTNNVYVKYSSAKQGEMALVCDKSKHLLSEILDQELC